MLDLVSDCAITKITSFRALRSQKNPKALRSDAASSKNHDNDRNNLRKIGRSRNTRLKKTTAAAAAKASDFRDAFASPRRTVAESISRSRSRDL